MTKIDDYILRAFSIPSFHTGVFRQDIDSQFEVKRIWQLRISFSSNPNACLTVVESNHIHGLFLVSPFRYVYDEECEPILPIQIDSDPIAEKLKSINVFPDLYSFGYDTTTYRLKILTRAQTCELSIHSPHSSSIQSLEQAFFTFATSLAQKYNNKDIFKFMELWKQSLHSDLE